MLLTFLLFFWFHNTLAPALILQQESEQNEPVKVLVFGDSSGALGPGWQMLRDMFERHAVSAEVRSTAVMGTRACQWAKNPNNLAAAGENTFPGTGPDFVWLTLGSNDLNDPSYEECTQNAFNFATAYSCALDAAKIARRCNIELVKNLYARFPHVKIVQSSYDFPCAMGNCNPNPHWPYCGTNITCANYFGKGWGEALIYPLENIFGSDKFKALTLEGSCQQAANISDSSAGQPVMTRGSPCNMMVGCDYPAPGSKGAYQIGEEFWTKFFEMRVYSMKTTGTVMPPDPTPLPDWENQHHIETVEMLCNYDWIPNIQDAENSPPPCNRTIADYSLRGLLALAGIPAMPADMPQH